MKPMYKKGGKSPKKMRESWMEESKEVHFGKKPKKMKTAGFPDLNKDGKTTFADVLKGRGVEMKKSGGKSMKPGGGGRFAAMVGKLKGKGKSEESAKAIAASIGRKKYGKSKFQAMAAAGKKQMGGPEDDKKSTRVGARAEKVLGKAKANWQEAEAIRKFDTTEEKSNFAQDKFGRNASDKANQLYAKAERQENRAKRIKERSEFLKAAGKKMGGKKNC